MKIGFALPRHIGQNEYNTIIASRRIRVLDVIQLFVHDDFIVELYDEKKTYDLVIFQKYFDKSALNLATKLQSNGCKIILDINVNYYNVDSSKIHKHQNEEIMAFTELCDGVITTSEYLEKYIKKVFPKKPISVIEESIHPKYFVNHRKNFSQVQTLVWCGYADKASELYLIKDVLVSLYRKYKFDILIISQKNPKLNFKNIQVKFKKYDQKTISTDLLHGDLFIAPRDLHEPYNLGHSITKIATPMSVGIPVVASPVPSYEKSPAIFCHTNSAWHETLNNIFNNKINLKKKSQEGVAYCKENLSSFVIKNKYKILFRMLSDNKE